MKKQIIIPIVVLILFLTTKSVFAKGQTITGIPKQEARITTSQVVENKSEEKRNNFSEAKQKRIQNVYNAIKNGLEKRHTALLKIKAKIDARLTKNPINKDKTQALVELAKFTAAEAKYQTDLKALDAKFETLKNSAKPSELIKGLKDSVNLVREDLNAIKKVLTSTVTALAKAPKLEVTKTK